MNRELYVSTGTLVAQENGFDYKNALREISHLREKSLIDGLELMMLTFYYDKLPSVAEAVKGSSVRPATVHCEKDVGSKISGAALMRKNGNNEDSLRLWNDAYCLFCINCEMAQMLEIPRMVLHLWGGFPSDCDIEFNIEKYTCLSAVAKEHGVRLLVENVPSNKFDPLRNWKMLVKHIGDGGFVFDTRFGALHENTENIFADPEITAKIEHVHMSDFGGHYREFSALRPILHPGEGKVDFDRMAELLSGIEYGGTITLESPVSIGSAWDIPKLERSLELLKNKFCN